VTGPDSPRRSRRQLLLRWGLPVAALLVVALLLVLLLPGGDDDDPAPAAGSASTTSAAAALGEETEPTATVPPSPVTEQPAASVVAREGVAESARTVQASAADFTTAAEWSDGASVRVTDARQQVTSGRGPGERAGQPQTVFALELTNGSGAPLDLNAVVVQASYGGDRAQASPIYDAESVDFAGALAPGATATAVYSFTIPADQVGDVVLSVDVDGYRFPAVFAGAVPTG
jgi:hypothetical protein